MLETLTSLSIIGSAAVGALAGFVSGYLSVKLSIRDHENRLNNQRERNLGLDKTDDELRAEYKELCGRLTAAGNELIAAERKWNVRISELERQLPNCEAHKQGLLREITALRGEIIATLLTKISEISETNSRFREDVRQRYMTDTQTLTKETITSVGVAAIVNEKIDTLRFNELADIFRRLHELETAR